MTRVLVIGSSHTAALRAALGAGRGADPLPWGRMQVAFAAAPDRAPGALVIAGDHLAVPDPDAARQFRRICGRDRFALAAVDAIVFCGGLLAPHAVVRLWTEARWFPLPSARDLPQGLALLSEAAALAAAGAVARQALLWPLLAALQARGGTPLVALQGIRLSQDGIGTGRRMAGPTRIARGEDAAALSGFYDRATRAALEPLARVILQPQDTRSLGFFTAPAFCRGATRLSAADDMPQPDGDFLHGNAAYGARMLDAIAAALDAA